MKRLFSAFAYSDAPRAHCWWDETAPLTPRGALAGDQQAEVAIIGAGFTGLSAALHLAKAGVQVVVVDSRYVGWGASGRNGGFCCLGGGKMGDAALERRFGTQGRLDWLRAELAAVELVDEITQEHGIEVDRHSAGETALAHRAKDMAGLRASFAQIKQDGLFDAELIEKPALRAHGMGGAFHGALTIKAGFALNPRKYVLGLARAAEAAGAVIYHDTPVQKISGAAGDFRLVTAQGSLRAQKVIVATNGYSSDDVPRWLGDRYMPAQSSVIVTRQLSPDEIAAQGWSSGQMAYDTRNLLHYFRLMPDRRFLFGMRGGLLSGAWADRRALAAVRRDFEAMFPAWGHVDTPFGWSGMVCLARDLMPFAGEVPEMPGLFTGMCYHGNGVAMGSYTGALLADLLRGVEGENPVPAAMRAPLARFGLGRARRVVMPPAYLGMMLADR